MNMSDQFVKIKETQYYHEWQNLFDQIHSIQSSNTDSQLNEKPIPRANSLLSTNPFTLTSDSLPLYTISSMRTTGIEVHEEKSDMKKSIQAQFTLSFHGLDISVRGTKDGDINIMKLKSKKIECSGSLNDSKDVGVSYHLFI